MQSAALLAYRCFGQMIPTTPRYNYVGIYKVNSGDSWKAWKDLPELAGSPLVEQESLLITHWDKLTEKLTKDQVQHPTSEGLAAEEGARARMGDDVMTGGTEKLGTA